MNNKEQKVTLVLTEGETEDNIHFDTEADAEDVFAMLVLGIVAMLDIDESKVKEICEYLVGLSNNGGNNGGSEYVH